MHVPGHEDVSGPNDISGSNQIDTAGACVPARPRTRSAPLEHRDEATQPWLLKVRRRHSPVCRQSMRLPFLRYEDTPFRDELAGPPHSSDFRASLKGRRLPLPPFHHSFIADEWAAGRSRGLQAPEREASAPPGLQPWRFDPWRVTRSHSGHNQTEGAPGPSPLGTGDRDKPRKACKKAAKNAPLARFKARKHVSPGNSEQPARAQRNLSRGLCAQRGGSSSAPLRATQPCRRTLAQIRNPMSKHFRP
jgi:hypothetical protein